MAIRNPYQRWEPPQTQRAQSQVIAGGGPGPLSGLGQEAATGLLSKGLDAGVSTGLNALAGQSGALGTIGSALGGTAAPAAAGAAGAGAGAAGAGLLAAAAPIVAPLAAGAALGKAFGLFNVGGEVPTGVLNQGPQQAQGVPPQVQQLIQAVQQGQITIEEAIQALQQMGLPPEAIQEIISMLQQEAQQGFNEGGQVFDKIDKIIDKYKSVDVPLVGGQFGFDVENSEPMLEYNRALLGGNASFGVNPRDQSIQAGWVKKFQDGGAVNRGPLGVISEAVAQELASKSGPKLPTQKLNDGGSVSKHPVKSIKKKVKQKIGHDEVHEESQIDYDTAVPPMSDMAIIALDSWR